MSDTNDDDDRTIIVASPGRRPVPAPAVTAPTVAASLEAAAADADSTVDNTVDDNDKTVMMKPSQRAKAAAVALSEERKEREADRTGPYGAATAPGASQQVDFDVMQGMSEKATPAAKSSVWPLAVALGVLAVALTLWLLLF